MTPTIAQTDRARSYRALAIIAAIAFAFTLGQIAGASRATDNLLTGIGCEGATGVIYAREESDFPICQEIY